MVRGRRARRRELVATLATLEASRRCLFCHVDLGTVPPPTIDTLDGRRFCSEACYSDFQHWEEHREQWRRAHGRTSSEGNV